MKNHLFLSGVCFALAFSLDGQQPGSPPPNGAAANSTHTIETSSVSGSVVNSRTGEPVRKATVELLADGSSQSLSSTSDSAGKFNLAGVSAGSYRVRISRTGFVRPQTRGKDSVYGPEVLTVSANQEIAGLVYQLAPASVLAGRVVDEDGAPFAGVQLQCLKYSYSMGSRRLLPVAFATSDDRGEYRLSELDPGRYLVRASYLDPSTLLGGSHSGGSRSGAEGYAAVYFPGVVEVGQAGEIFLAEGEERAGIDFAMSHARLVHVEGTLRTPDNRLAIADITLSLSPRMAAGFGAKTTRPGAEGAFRFDGVLPGSYLIAAHHGPGTAALLRQSVEVGDANVENLRLVLSPPIDVRGVVRLEGVQRSSFAELSLFLMARDDLVVMPAGSGRASLDANGGFVFHDVGAGDYGVQITSLPPDCFLKSVLIGGRPSSDGDLHVGDATAAGTVELLISATGGRVDGTLTNDQQQLAASSTVVLVPETSDRSRLNLFRTVTSDQNGHFSFRGVPPGDYKLFAWSQDLEAGSWRDPAVLAPYENQGKSVSVTESGRVSVDLQTILNR